MRDIIRRITNLISRAVIRRVDMSGDLPLVQVQAHEGETLDQVEMRQTYGFASWPKTGAEGVFFAVGGSRSHGVLLGIGDRRYRFEFAAEGEVAMFDDIGQAVYLARDGLRLISPLKVEIAAPEVNVTANAATLDADQTDVSGNLHVGGDLIVAGQATLGDGASKFVKLADNTNATTVKAL